jgi:kynureninase
LASPLPMLEVIAVPAADPASPRDADTAVRLLYHVHYRTGARHNMKALNEVADAAGALAIGDLSHSASAIPVALNESDADMAACCGYKFFNGVPARPPSSSRPPFAGNSALPIAGLDRPRGSVRLFRRLRTGFRHFLLPDRPPPDFSAWRCSKAESIFADLDTALLREKSARLLSLFTVGIAAHCPQFKLITIPEAKSRGNHISFQPRGG